MDVDYRVYAPSATERIRYYAVCMGGFAFTGWLFFDNLIAAVLLALCAIPFEKRWRKAKADKRRKELAAQFKDMLAYEHRQHVFF